MKGLIIVPGQGTNVDNIGMSFSIYKVKVCWVKSLEGLDGAILMSTHNIHFHDKVRKFTKNWTKYLFSWAIGRISQGLKNEFEEATVNEPWVFKLEVLL